jgi:hypothetical protein
MAVAVEDGTPRLVVGGIADPLDATLAVGTNPVVLSSLLLADNLQVVPAAVEPVVIEKYNLLTGAWPHQLAVQVQQAVLPLDLDVPDGVALFAVAFGPVTPAKVGKQWMILVVNQDGLTLGEWDELHGSEPPCRC